MNCEVNSCRNERRVFLAPSQAHQRQHGGILVPLSRTAGSLVPAHRIAPVEDEMRHALGMPYRVGDRDGAALRDPKQREPLDIHGADDGLQIVHEGVERDVVDGAIR